MNRILNPVQNIFLRTFSLHVKSEHFPSEMHLDEQVGSTRKDICKLFANFFQETYTTYSEEDRDREYFDYHPDFASDISVSQINVHDILNALNHLDASKGPGPDGTMGYQADNNRKSDLHQIFL